MMRIVFVGPTTKQIHFDTSATALITHIRFYFGFFSF